MKKLISIAIGVLMMVSLAACGSDTAPAPQENANTQQEESDAQAGGSNGSEDLSQITGAIFEGPVMLTSVGQSADVSIINTLFSKAEIETSMNNTLTADDLSGYNTLVLAVGGSSKGLGAAGIDENQEIERVQSVIDKAKDEGIKILALHIGGSARRGVLSDMFIPLSFENADGAIVLSEGDTDNLMRDILTSNNVPSEYIENQIDAIEPIKTLFGQ